MPESFLQIVNQGTGGIMLYIRRRSHRRDPVVCLISTDKKKSSGSSRATIHPRSVAGRCEVPHGGSRSRIKSDPPPKIKKNEMKSIVDGSNNRISAGNDNEINSYPFRATIRPQSAKRCGKMRSKSDPPSEIKNGIEVDH